MEDRKVGSYALIVNKERKIAIIKYNDGYCLPGGGVKNGEPIIEALKRELYEELNYTVQNQEIKLLDMPYIFTMPENKRKGKPAHEENHYFSIIRFEGEYLEYAEKKKEGKILRLDPEKLLSDDVCVFKELKEYYSHILVLFYNTNIV